MFGAGRLSLVPAAAAALLTAVPAAGRLGRDAWVISSFGDIGDAARACGKPVAVPEVMTVEVTGGTSETIDRNRREAARIENSNFRLPRSLSGLLDWQRSSTQTQFVGFEVGFQRGSNK